MPGRTKTAYQNVLRLPQPDSRTIDFTKAAETPHHVRITVPKGSSYKSSGSHWSESHRVSLECLEGRIHTFTGTGPYRNGDHFWGPGGEELYQTFELHYWQRSRDWQTGQSGEKHVDLEKGEGMEVSHKDDPQDADLVVQISPSSDYWDQKWGPRHELFYRNHISMELDASIYPSLPTAPLPIRLLFKLPSFLFPKLLRDRLIAWFLSVQLLVLYSANVDFHPNLGSLPIMFVYSLLHAGKYWMPFAPQLPEWVARWQYNNMIVMSHLKIAFWSRVGKWFLGMRPTYEEYTPERLKDALDSGPGRPD